jgi:diguanylate cyclase (GGDEF)-like protein/PAS domain S-box-containing protein
MANENDEKRKLALDAFKPFEHFCKAMLDGFVVVDADGCVVKANPMIGQMCGLTTKQILGMSSFDEIFPMFVGEKQMFVQELLKNIGPTRFDEVACKPMEGKDLNLIIGYYPFLQNGAVVGAWLLIRDVTAETELQGKYKDKATKSITDPMTGLFNRGHFEEYLRSQETALLRLPIDSDHRNLSVIMGDIDFFKKINDKYGHPTGDYVIKSVAGILGKAFRKTDIICRYGGEEFLIILPSSNLDGAAVAADKVRAAIESYLFVFEGSKIPVTMSFGVSQLMVGKESGTDAVARADAGLYASKQNGRNRVSLHTGAGIIPFDKATDVKSAG